VQTVFRAWRALRNARAIRDLRAQILVLEGKSERCEGKLTLSSLARRAFADAHPDVVVLHRFLAHLHTTDAIDSQLLHLLYHETELTRERVKDAAEGVLETDPPTTKHPFICSKAVLKLKHFPVILGHLPLPEGLRKVVLENEVGEYATYYVQCTDTISEEHARLLSENFKPKNKWRDHMVRMMRERKEERQLFAYDFFTDPALQFCAGSVVVTKLLTRASKGGVVTFAPALSIESIVARTKSSGTGNFLFAFCKALLWTDATDVEDGFLFAQCLAIPFWNTLLDVSNLGRCLAFQMESLYADYEYEEACTVRGSKFNKFDDVPSPLKKKA
jgi:hypothetical protein